jgi:arylsulfatase
MKSFLSILTITAALAAPAAAAERPNIVLIMVDDMGFSDIGCYGGEVPTPNLDRLAAEGLRFTQFYNTGRCCPTRASLLTGLYPHQAGVGHMTDDYGPDDPGYRGHLSQSCLTIAEVLRPAGYFTAVAGKWHVGHQDTAYWPLQRGFDRFYGVPEGGGFYFQVKPGRTIVLNNEVLHSVDKPIPNGWYSTDAFTEYGIRFIDEAIAANKPFFLYLAHNAPHFPLQAPQEDIDRYLGKYAAGWDVLRRDRHARQLELGLVEPGWPLTPRDERVTAWADVDREKQAQMDHIMAIYAAVVDRMDRSIGTLVDALKKRGVLDDTLILFLSDNGGNAESGPWGKAGGPGPLGSAQSDVFCGMSWANAENTPFRLYKHYVHEGGISTPLIAHWPQVIRQGGQITDQPGHVIDLLATCADVAGADYPATYQGNPITPLEGKSLAPIFRGEKRPGHEMIFWEHEGNRAVRWGNWKLVAKGRQGPWELYDLSSDRTELTDLAQKQPETATRLAAAWETWAERAHVKPWPTRGGK